MLTDPAEVVSSPLAATAIQGASGVFSLGIPPLGYELHEEIGRGGMGIVYRALDTAMNREVAVKILLDKFAPDSRVAQRFVEEAQITGQLQHPGIPAVYQVGNLADGRPYLAMKLIKGWTLDKLLTAHEKLDYLPLIEAIAQAVGYAHAHRVIHRDLKPANVMVGPFGEVQVMDWGLAKVLTVPTLCEGEDPNATTPSSTEIRSARAGEGDFTQAGSVIGTPLFMAPEQAAEELDKFDARSDVFRLGAILCVLLTGKPPFAGKDADSVRINAMRGKTEEALARLDVCGAEAGVIALCKRCLSFEPNDRPADGHEVVKIVALLRREADERAHQAELERIRTQVQIAEQSKRRRLWLSAGGAVAAILLIGIIGTTWGMVAANKAAEEARNAEQRELERRLEAETATTLARQRFRMVLDNYSQTVRAIEGNLKSEIATRKARRELFENVRAGLRELLLEAERYGNPDQTILWVYLLLGQVEMSLGDMQAAQKQYRTGNEVAHKLVEADPNNVEARRNLSLTYDRLGEVSLKMGQTTEARDAYHEKLQIDRKLADANHNQSDDRRELSTDYEKLGTVSLRLGQIAEAREFFRKAVEVFQNLADRASGQIQPQRELAARYEMLGDKLLHLEQSQEHFRFYSEGLQVRQRLVDAHPDNSQLQHDLNLSYYQLGDTSFFLGQTEKARDCYQRALKGWLKLVGADAKDRQAQSYLSGTYVGLGNVALRLGQPKEAQDFYLQALELDRRLAEADLNYERRLGSSYQRLGDLALRSREFKAALEFYQKALTVRQRRAEGDLLDEEAQAALSISYLLAGDAALKLERVQEALGYYYRAFARWQRWVEADPMNSQIDQIHSILCQRLGNTLLKEGQAEEALRFFERSLPGKQRQAEAEPNNPQAQSELLGVRLYVYFLRNDRENLIATVKAYEALAQKHDKLTYNAACAWSLASGLMKIEAKFKEEFATKALTLLKKTRTGQGHYFGSPAQLAAHAREDTDLDPLRERADFKEWLADLEK